MYTVKTMCAYLDISHTGLHDWADRYSKYLSEAATDSTADTGRVFSDQDAALLWTVKEMRAQNIPHKDITKQLDNGYRIAPPNTPADLPGLPAVARSEAAQLQIAIERLQGRIEALEGELQASQDENKALRGQVDILKETLKELYREKGS